MWVWESINMAKMSPKNSLTQCQLKIVNCRCVCVSVITCLLEIKWEKLIYDIDLHEIDIYHVLRIFSSVIIFERALGGRTGRGVSYILDFIEYLWYLPCTFKAFHATVIDVDI